MSRVLTFLSPANIIKHCCLIYHIFSVFGKAIKYFMRVWRNSRRASLRSWWEKSREGANPSTRTAKQNLPILAGFVLQHWILHQL
jgi:hypothetical protein